MDKRVTIAGIGPGSREYVIPEVQEIIEKSDVLMGGRRNLELFRYLNKEEVVIGSRLETVTDFIRAHAGKKNMVVLASGDPGIYSISQYLKRQLPEVPLKVLPGISSLQVLCARVNTNWDDVFCTSLHGRDPVPVAPIVRRHPKTAFFTGGNASPEGVCRELVNSGMKELTVTVGEKLSYPDERIITGTPETIAEMTFESLSVMLVERKDSPDSQREEEADVPGPQAWQVTAPGIPDHAFLRGEVPMTKEEVRAVAVSKLRLRKDSVVYDIGAGTGSVSVECGLLVPEGHVYAIERNREAAGLIRQNQEKFELRNLTLIEGLAPEAMVGLPMPDRVFIGGTGGSMTKLLHLIASWEHPCRVVINAVVLETVSEAMEGLQKSGFENLEVVCVAVSKGRAVGKRHMMQALNPVYVISADHRPVAQEEVVS